MTASWHTRGITLAAAFALLCTMSEPAAARSSGACDRLVTAGSVPGSVQELVDALRPGESGCLRGAFSEGVTIRQGGLPGRPITIRSAPGTRATLRGRLWVRDSADDVVVAGLVLDGRNDDGLPSPTVHGDRIAFRGNEITNVNTAICFVLGSFGGGWGIAVDTVIEGNRIHHCGELPATNHQHGIYRYLQLRVRPRLEAGEQLPHALGQRPVLLRLLSPRKQAEWNGRALPRHDHRARCDA